MAYKHNRRITPAAGKSQLSRRYFIKASFAAATTIALGDSLLSMVGCSPGAPPATSNVTPPATTPATTLPAVTTPPGTTPPATTTPLVQTRFQIPPLLKNTSSDPTKVIFELDAQKGQTAFISGKNVATFGFNGSYLGPTIRVKKGQQVNMTVKNQLDEVITTHWHGALVPGDADGGPHQTIAAGGVWNPQFTIDQQAATLWYHAHPMGYTGEQVYKGLAGLFIVDDDVSASLSIPKDYGINDIPLVIQDKRFAADGSLLYMDQPDDNKGMQGDTILVNGFVNATLDVSTIKMRFRILNASNARIYSFILSDNSSFTQIASDNGFLEAPVVMDTLRLAPGERAEVIIDFSNHAVGDIVTLQSRTNTFMNIMDFSVVKKTADTTTIPAKLTTITKIAESSSVKTRTFVMGGMGAAANINGLQMNLTTGMDTIHESVNLGDTEIWTVTSAASGGMSHPFHAHGVHFQVLDINGAPPPANLLGWKDTVLVDTANTVRLIGTFKYAGIYMLHCHNLEHEDAGMMLQYQSK